MIGEMSIALDAPAKINLYLHITGRRPDGYHLLDSLFLFLDLSDRLSAEPASDLSMTIGGPWSDGHGLEGAQNNLVLKAARLLRQKAGISNGAKFHLQKCIPVAAGLGGGSADAAAALRLCARLWGLEVPMREMHALALQLGADVPPCLYSRPCHVAGIGEDVKLVEKAPDWGILLVNPRVSVSTAEIFRRFKDRRMAFRPQAVEKGRWHDFAWLEKTTNDLQAVALEAEPVIQDVIKRIGSLPGCRLARMSGSGATCFGLFDNVAAAHQAHEVLSSGNAEWWTWHGAIISGREDSYSTC